MDDLTKEIDKIIVKNIDILMEKFINKVSSDTDIDKKKLNEIWEEIKYSEDIKQNNLCPYKYTKGENIGTRCNCKVKKGEYCSRHKKYEGKTREEKDIGPISKRSLHKEKKHPQILLRKHREIGVLWHPQTRFAFKSRDDKKVIGRISEKEIKALSPEDIKICKNYGFIYEENIE